MEPVPDDAKHKQRAAATKQF